MRRRFFLKLLGVSPAALVVDKVGFTRSGTRRATDKEVKELTRAGEISGSWSEVGVSEPIAVRGYFSFGTFGNWEGTVNIERKEGSGWEVFRTWTGCNDKNIQFYCFEECDDVQYRINVTEMKSGTINADMVYPDVPRKPLTSKERAKILDDLELLRKKKSKS